MSTRLNIGISACLAGENVRFDGGHRKDYVILQEFGNCFNLQSFCPELAIGMGVPRQTIHLVRRQSGLAAIGVKNSQLDVTKALSYLPSTQRQWLDSLSGFIVKKDSPSCGMERVKIYGGNRADPTGRGLYTEQLAKHYPLLPIEEEGRLRNPLLLDSFIQRVYAYARWKALEQKNLKPHSLIHFHSQYKMILLARNQQNYRQLGRMVASVTSQNIKRLSQEYISQFMETLKKPATRPGNVNVLQHLQGFLKNHLPKEEKQNLTAIVTRYGKGELPLIAPKILLNMYFQRHRFQFIDGSLYLKPYPIELGIYNKL